MFFFLSLYCSKAKLKPYFEPHVHPSPFCSSPSPPKGRPFQKTEPIFIAPYLTFSLLDDARVACLVPIRGTLPWEHCTSAVFLDTSHIIPIPSSIADQVFWTQGSLLKLWSFYFGYAKWANSVLLEFLSLVHCNLEYHRLPLKWIIIIYIRTIYF